MSQKTLSLKACALLACLGLVMSGCNKDEETEPEFAPVNVANTPSPNPNQNRPIGGGGNQNNAAANNDTPEEVDPEAGFPTDLAEWTDDDFRKAREINHSRLAYAVMERAGNTEDDEDAAKFWLALLEIEPPSQGRAPNFAEMTDPGAPDAEGGNQNANIDPNSQGIADASDPLGMNRMAVGDSGGGGGSGGGAPGTNNSGADDASMGDGSAQEIVKTLIDAAIQNTTSASLATLTAVLSGAIANGTPDDVMVGLALDGLKESKQEAHQALMLQALLKPGELRDEDDEDGMSALDLQQAVFDKMEGAELSRLKMTLAEGIADATPEAAADAIVEHLLDDDFDNFEAQVVLFQSGAVTDDDLRAELRDLLASYSKSAFDLLMGLTEAAEPVEDDSDDNNNSGRGGPRNGGEGGGNVQSISVGDEPIGGANRNARNNANNSRSNPGVRSIPLTDEQAATIAGAMWTKKFEETVLNDLSDAGSLEDAGDDVNLAGVLPMHAVRRKMAEMVENNWQRGPQSLADRGLFTTIFHEPGTLMVSKSAETNFPRNFNPGGEAPANPRAQERFEENKLKYDWFTQIYNQVEAMKKMYAEAPEVRSNFGNGKPPVRLHRGAENKEELVFEANWPEDIARKASAAELDPLRVQYARIHTTDVLNLVNVHYTQTLRGGQSYPLQNGGVWVTKVETDTEKGVTRSIDIFVQPGDSLEEVNNNSGAGQGGGSSAPGRKTASSEGGSGCTDAVGGIGGGGSPGRGNRPANARIGVVVEMLVVETPAIAD